MALGDACDLSGRAHRRALDALIEHHDEVVTGTQPSVIVVEGAPGVGKSKLLLEFYRALGRRQADPRYWPEPDGSWNGYPASVRPLDAKMPYFWWGIPCPPTGRARAFQVLGDEITQIEAHAALLIATDQTDEVLGDAARNTSPRWRPASRQTLSPVVLRQWRLDGRYSGCSVREGESGH